MKKVVLLLLALLVCVSSFCDETESRTIMIAKGAALYPISDWKMTNLQKDIRDGNRTVMTFSNSERPTKLRRNTEMPIIRLINMVKGLEFDSYVVEYNGAYYVVSATDALDNSYLTEVNNYLKERRDFAKIANSEKAKMLPSVNAELQDSILALRNRNTALSKRINEEIEDATKDLTLEQEDAVLELMNSLKGEDESWYKKQSAAARKAIDAIEIFHFTLTKANSVGGHDAIFSFSNNTLKKIKYIDLTAKVKNAVDDYVSCDIRRTDTFKGRITGPLGFGSNEQVWENVIYNWSGSKIELIAMTITYMDGTTLVCDKATSKALMEFQDHNSVNHKDLHILLHSLYL